MSDPSADAPGMLPDAGWYPDPTTPGLWRWWDGVEWTEHIHRPQGPDDEAVVAATQAATAAAVAEAASAAASAAAAAATSAPAPAPGVETPGVGAPGVEAPSATPGLILPDPSLIEPDAFPAGYAPVHAGLTPSLQAPQYVELPTMQSGRPAGYVPPIPAPFPPPTPDSSPPTLTGRQPVYGTFQGRGSSLQTARAVRTQTVAQRQPNPVAVVSLVFGIVAMLLPVVIFALVAIFTGLFGLRRAADSYPASGRGAATGGVVLGIISLLLTAIASMIAMADPTIRAIVLGAI